MTRATCRVTCRVGDMLPRRRIPFAAMGADSVELRGPDRWSLRAGNRLFRPTVETVRILRSSHREWAALDGDTVLRWERAS